MIGCFLILSEAAAAVQMPGWIGRCRLSVRVFTAPTRVNDFVDSGVSGKRLVRASGGVGDGVGYL